MSAVGAPAAAPGAPTAPGAARLLARVDRWLTWRRACLYASLLLALYVTAWAYVVANGAPPLNSAGEPIGGDYIAFHAAGRLVLDGHADRLYDPDWVVRTQDALLGGRVPGFYDAFRNPPFFALVFVPLAPLPLPGGVAVWTALSLGCLGLALRLLLEDVPSLRPRWRGLLLLVLAFPPVYFGLVDGENATVSLLLYVLIYRALVRQQARAGVWAALGLFKPQLFFVFPLVFLASRRWRALAVYLATAVLLAGVSLALVGPAGVADWLHSLLAAESGNATANAWRMVSLKSLFDSLLPGHAALAVACYAAAAVALLVPLLHAWAPTRQPIPVLWAWTSLTAVLVDPHIIDYDLSVLVAAGVLAWPRYPQVGRWLACSLYVLLLLRAHVSVGFGSIQLATLATVGAVLLAWRTHQRDRAPAERTTVTRTASG